MKSLLYRDGNGYLPLPTEFPFHRDNLSCLSRLGFRIPFDIAGKILITEDIPLYAVN